MKVHYIYTAVLYILKKNNPKAIYNSGTLYVYGGSIYAVGCAIYCSQNTTTYINGGHIYYTGNANCYSVNCNTNSKIYINGGYIAGSSKGYSIQGGGSEIIISGGTVQDIYTTSASTSLTITGGHFGTIESNGNLTITGGTFAVDNSARGTETFLISAQNPDATVTITGGKFTGGDSYTFCFNKVTATIGSTGGADSALTITASDDSVAIYLDDATTNVTVESGTISGSLSVTSGSLEINGGTYDSTAATSITTLIEKGVVAANVALEATTDNDGNTVYTATVADVKLTKTTTEGSTDVAYTGTSALTEALAAIATDTEYASTEYTIVLGNDYELTSAWTIAENYNITLDLNGYTLTITGYESGSINNSGTLTIKDSVGTGKLNLSGGNYGIRNNGTLTIKGGSITNTSTNVNWRYGILNYGTVSITGGSISTDFTGIFNYGNVTIDGGTISVARSSDSEMVVAIQNSGSSGIVVVESGTIQAISTSGGNGFGILQNNTEGGKTTINGGTITGNAVGIIAYANTSVTVNGGTISSTTAYNGIENAGTLIVTDGTIKGYYNGIHNSGTATINGGTIVGTYASGIYSTGSVEIISGTITGNGYYGIEITGTLTISGDNTIIYGAVYGILATGTTTISGGSISGGTAGISNTGTLTVSGKTTVSGNSWGIRNIGTVTVKDNVAVTGGSYGIYSIGTDSSTATSVIITGGTIKATSSNSAIFATGAYGTVTIGEENGDDSSIAIEGKNFGIELSYGTTATLYSGSITGNYGVYLYGYSSSAYTTFNMWGGSISATYFGVAGNGSEGSGYDKIYIYAGTITSKGIGIYLPQKEGYTYIYGGTISGSTGVEIRGGVVVIDDNADDTAPLYIYGATDTYSASSNSSGATTSGMAIAVVPYASHPMEVAVSSGTFTGYYSIYENNVNSIADTSLPTIEIEVTGGTFIGDVTANTAANSTDYVLTITGGTYNTDVSTYAASGFTATETSTGSGVYTITLSSNNDVLVKVSSTTTSTEYATLEAAITAINNSTLSLSANDEVEILLYDNISLDNSLTINPSVACNITLNLNGYSITFASGATLTNSGNLTITGNGSSTLTFVDEGGITNSGGATLTIEGVITITTTCTTGTGDIITNNGTMYIKGGTIKSELRTITNKGTMYVSGGTISGGYLAISNTYNSTLYVTGGTIYATSYAAIDSYGTTIISGGTIGYSGKTAVYVNNNNVKDNVVTGYSTVTISGGYFIGSITKATSGSISITGGYFTDTTAGLYVATGYAINSEKDGTYTEYYQVMAESDFAATINGVGYETLQGAIDAAAIGDTVKVVAFGGDEYEITSAITVSSGDDIILDLNGVTLTITGYDSTYYCALLNQGTLTITNGTLYASALAESGGMYYWGGIRNYGTLTINDDAIIKGNFVVIANYGGSVDIYGTIIALYYSTSNTYYAVYNSSTENSVVNIYGGAYIYSYNSIGNNGTINVYGGTISGVSIGIVNNGTLNMSAGTVLGVVAVKAQLSASSTTITGGIVIGTSVGVAALNATVTLGEENGNDEDLIITSGSGGNAVEIAGYASYTGNATVTLYSGTIGSYTYNGTEYNSDCGIFLAGYSENTYAVLCMHGGTVTATSIGISGNGLTDRGYDKIYIYDGTVSAAYGMYLPQTDGETYIYGGTITGSVTGVEIRAGSLTIEDGTIISTSETFDVDYNGSGTTVIGAAIAISQHTTEKEISVNISGGTFKGYYAIYETDTVRDEDGNVKEGEEISANITDGTFEGMVGSTSTKTVEGTEETTSVLAITGGVYTSTTAAAYVTGNFILEGTADANGYYGIEPYDESDPSSSDIKATITDDSGVTTGYKTLQAAINAAADGATITLTADLTETSVTISADDSITLDLDGNTLTATIYNNGKLTVKNGTLTGTIVNYGGTVTVADGATVTGTDYAIKSYNGEVTISGGTITGSTALYLNGTTVTISGGTIDGAVYLGACSGEITGGTFSGAVTIDGGTVVISGGTFSSTVTIDGAKVSVIGGTYSSADIADYIDTDEYALAPNTDDTYTVKEISEFVATINGIGYSSLSEAVAAATESDIIVIAKDIELSETLTISKTITIDLNGNTITTADDATFHTITVNSGSTLTVTDNSDNGDGSIVTKSTSTSGGVYYAIYSAGTLNIEGGTITGGARAIYVYESELTVSGGSIYATQVAVMTSSDSTVYINGGSISGGYGINNQAGTLTINGGTITGTSCGILSNMPLSTKLLTISGGEITGNYGLYLYGSNCDVLITGGTISGSINGIGTIGNGSGYVLVQGTIAIYGGTIESTSYDTGTTAAAIRIQCNADFDLTIAGGTITGPCGVNQSKGTLTVSGGTVTGTKTYGIHANSNLVINGGTIISETSSAIDLASGTLSVTSGTITGAINSVDISSSVTSASITGGYFDGGIRSSLDTQFISGGFFSQSAASSAASYMVDGYLFNSTLTDGYYRVNTASSYSASINGVGYSTLLDAITAAEDGDTVVILSNILLDSSYSSYYGYEKYITLTSGINITIDLNGKEIADNWAGITLITVESGATLKIIDSVGGGIISCTTVAYDDGSADEFSSEYKAIYVNGGNVTIDGGIIVGFISVDNGGSLTVNGGVFTDTSVISFIANGFLLSGEIAKLNTDDSSIYAQMFDLYDSYKNIGFTIDALYEVLPTSYFVATTTDSTGVTRGYTSLQNAIDAAGDTTTTITLRADVEENVSITSGTITLDLNGYSITNKDTDTTITISGSTTVVNITGNGSVVNTIASTSSQLQAIYVKGGATLNVGNATIKGAYNGIRNGKDGEAGGTVNLNSGATVIGSVNAGIQTYSTVNINDGASVEGKYGITFFGKDSNYTVVTINGGTITGTGDAAISSHGVASFGYVKLNIYGGTIISDNEVAIYMPAVYGETTISGTETSPVEITGATGIEIRAGKLTISGNVTIKATGAFDVTPNDNGSTVTGAAVAISQHTTNKAITVNISGGTFTGVYAVYETDTVTTTTTSEAIEIGLSGGTYNGSVASTTKDETTGSGYALYITDGSYSSTTAADYVTSSYALSATVTVIDGVCYYGIVDATSVVAQIGNLTYSKLQDAIDAAPIDGTATTITLLANTTEDITIANGQNITLDLNGKTLTNSSSDTITVEYGATLTIIGDGTVDNVTHGKAAIFNYGEVYLYGGTYTRSKEAGVSTSDNGSNSFYVINNRGTMVIGSETDETLNNVTVQTVDSSSGDPIGKYSSLIENGWATASQNTTNATATLIINGGTFKGGLNTVKNDDYGELEINGGSFTNNNQIVVMNYNVATITGGTFTVTDDGWTAIWVNYDSATAVGNLTITGGTFINTNPTNEYVVYVSTSSNGSAESVVITGGTFTGYIGLSNATKAEITGGEFSNTSAAAYVVSGSLLEGVATQGDYFGVNKTTTYVAQIGNLGYTTLQAAINAAANGDKITLLKDVAESVTVSLSGSITLNLAGYSITSSGTAITVNSGAELTIDDNTGNGKIIGSNVGIKNDGGSVTINGGYIYGGNRAIQNKGTLIVNDGTLEGETNGIVHKTGSITINGGTVTGGKFGIYYNESDKSSTNNATTVINNGIVSGGTYGIYQWFGTVTVNGGTVQSSDGYGIVILGTFDTAYSKLYVNDGTITGSKAAISSNGETGYGYVEIYISGGTITCANDTAIYLPAQYGKTVITGGEITGTTGIEIRMGSLTIGENDGNDSYIVITSTAASTSQGSTPVGGGSTVTGAAVAISSYNNKDISVNIYSGTFNGLTAVYEGYIESSNLTATIDINLAGGTYNGAICSDSTTETLAILEVSGGVYSDTSAAAYVVDGFALNGTKNSDGYYGIIEATSSDPGAETVVATITTDGVTLSYTSLQEAIAAANDGTETTIKIVATVTEDSGITIAAGQNIVLDLNGYTVTIKGNEVAIGSNYACIINNGTLKITDNSTSSDGQLVISTGNYGIYNVGYLEIAGGNISGAYTLVNITGGTLIVNGGKISGSIAAIVNNGGTTTVNDGEISATDRGIWNRNSGNLYINGGEISAAYGVATFSCETIITGGTISGGTSGIYVSGSSTTVTVGGTAKVTGTGDGLSGTSTSDYVNTFGIAIYQGATVTVEDGAIIEAHNTEGNYVYGIGILVEGEDSNTYSSLHVYGGTITADSFAICSNGSKTLDRTSGGSTITYYPGYVKIYIYGGIITSNKAAGMYLPGTNGETYIYGGTITGTTAIEIRAGVLTITDGTFIATATEFKAEKNGNGSTVTGAAIAISQHTTNLTLSVAISGGTFSGYYAVYEVDLQDAVVDDISIALSGGTYISTNTDEDSAAAVSSQNVTGFISGGYYSVLPADSTYYADGKIPAYYGTIGSDGNTYYTVVNGNYATVVVDTTFTKGADEYTYSAIYNGTEYTFIESTDSYIVTKGTGTAAGEYTVTVTLASGYVWADTCTTEVREYTFTITSGSLTITVAPENYSGTYDGKEHTGSVTVTTEDGCEYAITYSTEQNGNYSDTIPTFTEVGTHYVYFKVTAANHNEASGYFTVEITQATYDISGISFEDKTVAYDGSAYSLEILGTLPDGLSANYSQSNITAAGTYEITVTFTNSNSNYNDVATTMTATLTIAVATIGDTGYGTLAEAISAATSGDTITLVADLTVTGGITISASQNITLDLNGKELVISGGVSISGSNKANILNNGTLNITDSVGGGIISMSGAVYGIYNKGTLKVDGDVTITNAYNSGRVIHNVGDAIISNGTISGAIGVYSTGTLTVKGGDIKATGSYGIYVDDGTTTVSGGTTITATGGAGVFCNTGKVIIKDNVSIKARNGVYVQNGIAEISGGTIEATLYGVYMTTSASTSTADVTISGEAEISGGTYSVYTTCGDVELSGGTFNGEVKSTSATKFITGGYYSDLPSDNTYYAEGNVPTATTVNGTTYYSVTDGTFVTAPEDYAMIYSGEGYYLATGGTGYSVLTVKDSNGNTITNGTATEVGTYEVTVTLLSGYMWSDLTTTEKTYTVTIANANVDKPTANDSTFTYDGSEQTYLESTVYYTVTDGKQINAGTYSVTVTLNAGYTWSDGSTDTLSFSWTIGKAENSISVSISDWTYGETASTPTATTTDGDSITYTYYSDESCDSQYIVNDIITAYAGTYWVMATVAETTNYKSATTSEAVKFAIEKADNNVTVSIDGWTYGEANKTATATAIDGKISYSYYSDEACTTEVTDLATAGAGTYWIVATVAETTNYKEASATISFVIEKATVLPSVDTSKTYTYDGSEQTFITLTGDEGYTVSDGNTATNAGTYTVTLKLEDSANYEWAADAVITYTWTIGKAIYDMSGVSFNDLTVTYEYGITYSLIATGLPTGVTVEYVGNDQTNAGTYTITAIFTGDSVNYNAIDYMTATLTISKATVDLSTYPVSITSDYTDNSGVYTYEYTGSEIAFISTTSSLYSINGTVSATNAGTYSVTLVLTDSANYVWATDAVTTYTWAIVDNSATYAVAMPTVTSDSTFTYDGTAKTYTLKENADAYTISGTTSATKVGTYEVTVTLNTGYTWLDGSTDTLTYTWAIGKATYDMSNVTFNDTTVAYDGKTHSIELTLTGITELPEGLTVSYSGSGTNVGEYIIIATFINSNTNYNDVAAMTAILTISASTVDKPTVGTSSYDYDGTTKEFTLGSNVAYTISGTTSATNAGIYTVIVTLNANYTWIDGSTDVLTYVFVINNATMTVSASGYSGSYDGSAHTGNVTVGTLINNATATIKYGTTSGTYNLTTAPVYTEVGSYVVYYEVTAANYNNVYGSYTVTITEAEPVVVRTEVEAPAVATATYTYTGKAITYALAENAAYTITGATQTNAGSYIVTVTLNDTEKYMWADGSTAALTYVFVISNATMNVSANGYSGSYDGSAHTGNVTVGTLINNATVTIKYGTTSGTYNLTTAPVYTDVGTYVVYYEVTAANYNSVYGSYTVTITEVVEPTEETVVTASDSTVSGSVSSDNGFVMDVTIEMNLLKESEYELTVTEISNEVIDTTDFDSATVVAVYDITLTSNGENVTVAEATNGGKVTVSVAIPTSLVGQNFYIVHIHDGVVYGVITNSDYSIENGNVTFEVEHLSQFAFVAASDSADTDSGLSQSEIVTICAIVGGTVAVTALLALAIIHINRSKRRRY